MFAFHAHHRHLRVFVSLKVELKRSKIPVCTTVSIRSHLSPSRLVKLVS